MTAVPQHTLPLATTSPFTPSARVTASDHADWSGTFDRALKGIRAEGVHGQHARTVPAPMLEHRMSPAPTTLLAQHAGLPPSTPASQVMHPAGEDVKPGCASAGASQMSTMGARLPDAPDAEPAQSRPPAQRLARQEENAPVRVHVEQHPEGLAIWIGADATLDSDAVAAMLATLRSAHPHTLVFNGRTVYASPRPPKENP